MSRGVGRDISLLLISRVTSGLAQALSLVLLARAAGVSDFGLLVAWTGVFLVVVGVLDLGMSGLLLVEAAEGNRRLVASVLALNRWTSVAAALFLGLVVFFFAPRNLTTVLLLLAVAYALEKNTDTALNYLLGTKRATVPAVSLMIRRVGTLAGVGVAIVIDPAYVALAYASAYLVTGAIAQVQVRAALRHDLRGIKSADSPLRVLSKSVHFLIQNASGQLRTLDVTVVAVVAGPSAAGVYAAATRLANPLLLVPGVLHSVLTPRAVGRGLHSGRRIAHLLILTSIGCVLACLAVVPFAPEIVTLLLGPQYAGAELPLVLALVAMVFVGFSTPLAGILQARRSAGVAAAISVAGMVALLVGVWLGSAAAGAGGASVGLLAAGFAMWLALAVAIQVGADGRGQSA